MHVRPGNINADSFRRPQLAKRMGLRADGLGLRE